MADKKITLSRVLSVPNSNGATNLGGVCSTGKTIFCCKTNSDENTTIIYKFKSTTDQNPTVKSFSNLGHANGMTYYKGYLYIPIWSKNKSTSGNSIAKIKFADKSKTIITGNSSGFSSITHYSGDYFIVGKSGVNFSLIKISGNTYTIVKNFTVTNTKKDTGYTMSQDIYYKNKILYIPMCNPDCMKSAVLLVKLGDSIVADKNYVPYKAWLSSSTTEKHEIESLTIDSAGHTLFGINKKKDGIFVKTN